MDPKSKRTLTVGTLAAALIAVLIPTGCATAAPPSPTTNMGSGPDSSVELN